MSPAPIANAPPAARVPGHGLRPGGFSLVELLITIAIAAIFMSVAAPSLTATFKGNRVVTEASTFVSDMALARSEAVKQGMTVSLCPSSNGSSCLGSGAWQSGWIVFTDVNANGVFDPAQDMLLRKRAAFTGTDTFAATAGTPSISFNREGFTTNLGTAVVMFQLHTADNSSTLTRCVSLDIAGRMNTLVYGGSTEGTSCT